MNYLKMQSRDMVSDNIKYIAERWPECLTEAKDENGKLRQVIDFDKLRQVLSADATGEGQERYQFTWPDKRHAIRLANAPITDTLRPCREESVDWNTTQNLYIEGDNLNVLKLLRESYLGKVKMIYIDPPYNTGGDFVYKDNFIKKNSDYAEVSGAYDKEGNLLVGELEKNADSNGRFHTDWLNMIYPRLKVARDLLSEDGVIFISIDDNEVENLRKVCDEMFGQSNFIACLPTIMNLKGNNDEFGFAGTHEYTLVYGKDIASIEELNGIALSEEDMSEYDLSDEKGKYKTGATLMRTGEAGERRFRPKGYYPIYVSSDLSSLDTVRHDHDDIEVYPRSRDGKDMSWRRSPENLHNTRNEFIIKRTSNGISFYKKQRLEEDMARGKKAKTLFYKPSYSSGNGTALFKELFNNRFFDNPKPLDLIKDFVRIGSNDESLIIDFFSGSATTAHAVMQLNAEDGGKRKFIMVQLPEETDADSEARKAGYKNICEIGKERIRRAGKKIKEENPKAQHLDTGFRVLKLDSSNMQDVFYTPAETTEQTLFADNIKPDRTGEDLLVQVMMELGIQLSDKIEKTEIAGKTVWNVSDGYLMACFDADVNEDTIKAIAKQKPAYFVLADRSLASDNVADNFEQLFEEYSPDTVRRII